MNRWITFAAMAGATFATSSPVAAQEAISVSIETVSNINEGSGVSAISFVVRRSGGGEGSAQVQFRTVDDTATSGNESLGCGPGWPTDFLATSGGMIIPQGREGQIDITVCGDNVFEDNECFAVELLDPGIGTAIANERAEACILNDDEQPQLIINNFSGNEGNAGSTPFRVPVQINAAAQPDVSFSYSLRDSTAAGGNACSGSTDYVRNEGVVTIPGGTTTATIDVAVCGDTRVEPNERLLLDISNPSNVSAPISARTITITNDDEHPRPTLTRLDPATIGPYNPNSQSGLAATFGIAGQNFVPGMQVLIDDEPLNTQSVSGTNSTNRGVVISFVGLSSGSHTVRVRNPAPGGGLSNPLTLNVRSLADLAARIKPAVTPTIRQSVTSSKATAQPPKTSKSSASAAAVRGSSPKQLSLRPGQRGVATLTGIGLEKLTGALVQRDGKTVKDFKVVLGNVTSKGRPIGITAPRLIKAGTYKVVALQGRSRQISTPLTIVVK